MSYRDNNNNGYGRNRDGYRGGGSWGRDRNYHGSQSGWNDGRNRGRGGGGTWRHSQEEERRRQEERRHQDRYYGSGGHYRPQNQRAERVKHEHNKEDRKEDSSNKPPSSSIPDTTSASQHQDEMKSSKGHNEDPHKTKRERESAMEIEMAGSVVKVEEQSIEKKAKIDVASTNSKIAAVNKDSWWDTPLDTKIISQLSPGMDYQITDDMIRLKEGTPLLTREVWMEKKIYAANRSLADIKAYVDSIRSSYDSEDSDSDDSMDYRYGDKSLGRDIYDNDVYSPTELESFITALPYNIIFDSGFLVPGVHPDDEKHCYCPCSKHMVSSLADFIR